MGEIMSFKERLQTIRKKRKLSQEDVADLLSVSRQAVAKWETGQSMPDVENLILLSDVLQVTVDQLLKDDAGCGKSMSEEIKGNRNEIIHFLCRAKRETYAANAPQSSPSRKHSHDLILEEGDFFYMDTYLGGEKFAGEEALWIRDIPYWSMNYCGRVLGDNFSGDFLKEALGEVPADKPFRGPMLYQSGSYTYHCTVEGDFEWFQGVEEIFYEGEKIYECVYHGGLIHEV